METFGFMTTSDTSELPYSTEIAIRAFQMNVQCYRFIPTNIHPLTQTVKGQIFNTTSLLWEDAEFPIPILLYDRCFYGEDAHSKQCATIVSWLKNRTDIIFLGYGLPNKFELYKILNQSPLYPYLPQTKFMDSPSVVLEELRKHRRIVLKPIDGSQGNGIFFIEDLSPTVLVKTFNRKKHVLRDFNDENKLLVWTSNLINKKDYLIQPYIELVNDKKEPFDIRILLQKDETGTWLERGRGLRIGNSEGILSNLHAGGRLESYETWLECLPEIQKEFIETEILDLLGKIPLVLENAFLPLFELGIDIGVAKNGSIWILDINSKPGRRVIIEGNPSKKDPLYFAPLLYGKLLTESVDDERKKSYDAKTLSY